MPPPEVFSFDVCAIFGFIMNEEGSDAKEFHDLGHGWHPSDH